MNRRKRTQFWGENENDDHLVRQIIAGDKTATCCPTVYFAEADGDYHDGGYAVGDDVEVYDLKGNLRCLITITDIYACTLRAFPDKLWQGECCQDAKAFRQEHYRCWQDIAVGPDTPITASHFQLKEIFSPS